MATIDAEGYRMPPVVSMRTYAFAAMCTLAAAVASALVVRRKLDRLDLVGVLKTREACASPRGNDPHFVAKLATSSSSSGRAAFTVFAGPVSLKKWGIPGVATIAPSKAQPSFAP